MADSYYENQSHSAASQRSGSPAPYSEYQNGSVNERAHSPNAPSYNTMATDIKPDIKPDIKSNVTGSGSPLIRKTLASWVGFSNLPNQVHRRSVR